MTSPRDLGRPRAASIAPTARARAARAVRVGLLSTVLVGTYWVGATWWLGRDACVPRQAVPYPCLGTAFLAVVGGAPLLVLFVALLLSGRGLRHSVVGGVVSVVLGTAMAYALLDIVDVGGPDVVGWLLTAPAVGVVAAAWAVVAPGRAIGHTERQPPGAGS